MKNKVRAFTIQELLVVLMLSSLLIGFVYAALHWIQMDFNRYTKSIAKKQVVTTVFEQVEKDVQLTKKNRFTNGWSLYTVKDSIRYYTVEDTLYRSLNNKAVKFYMPNFQLNAIEDSSNYWIFSFEYENEVYKIIREKDTQSII